MPQLLLSIPPRSRYREPVGSKTSLSYLGRESSKGREERCNEEALCKKKEATSV